VPLLTESGIILSAYLAAGRTGAIAACLFLDFPAGIALGVSLLLDIVQIPVCGLILEATGRKASSFERLGRWVRRRRELWKGRMEKGGFWSWIMRFHPAAVMFVSVVPVRGCGIISACLLAFMLGYSRVYGTVLIMAGSVIGALLTLGILIEPVRLLHAH
jgi:uncharacterized membrane protein